MHGLGAGPRPTHECLQLGRKLTGRFLPMKAHNCRSALRRYMRQSERPHLRWKAEWPVLAGSREMSACSKDGYYSDIDLRIATK